MSGDPLSIGLLLVPVLLIFRGLSVSALGGSPLLGLLLGALLAWMRTR
jgi:hypothetical protein